MRLSAGPAWESHDIGSAPLGKLSDRSLERSGKQTSGAVLKRDLMRGIFWNNENKLAANFNARRGAPEIAGTHTHSPNETIRLPELNRIFVIAGGLTKVNSRQPLGASDPAGRTLPHIRSAGSFPPNALAT